MNNGENREDALAMLDEAQILWLETTLEIGKAIPPYILVTSAVSDYIKCIVNR